MGDGAIRLLDASSLQCVAKLSSCVVDAAVVGLSVSPCGDFLWALHSDRSLTRWSSLEEEPDCALPPPVTGLRDARVVPSTSESSVVTCTDRGLQLWRQFDGLGLEVEVQTEPGDNAFSEITSMSCASWVAACGHRSG